MQPQLPIQLIDADSSEMFDEIRLDWTPHPGHFLQIGTQGYLILEKRHSYHLRDGRYCLVAIRAYVRPTDQLPSHPEQGVIGDPSCRYNALTPLLRCSVKPDGPCAGCLHYVRRESPLP
jgi:hypothetical protein